MDYFSLMALSEKALRCNGVGYTCVDVLLALIMVVSFIKVGFSWIGGFYFEIVGWNWVWLLFGYVWKS